MTYVRRGAQVSGGSVYTSPYAAQPDVDALDVHTQGWVNVKTHGAVGDGVTDDTAAINAAIAAASRAYIDAFEWHMGPGGTVFFPRGVYRVTSTLSITGEGVRVQGENQHTTAIKMDADVNTDAISVPVGTRNFSLRDLTIYSAGVDGVAGTKFRHGVVIDSAAWFSIHNVTVSYANGNGFWIRGTLSSRIAHARARWCGVGLNIGPSSEGTEATTLTVDSFATSYSFNQGIIVDKAYGVTFIAPASEYCGGSAGNAANGTGFLIGPSTATAFTEVTIIHPYTEQNFGWDFEIGRSTAHYRAMVTIIGGSHRAGANKQSGYGLALVDQVEGGGIWGGYMSGYAAPMTSVVFTNNASYQYNFNIAGLNFPFSLPPTWQGSGTVENVKGVITYVDGTANLRSTGNLKDIPAHTWTGGNRGDASVTLTHANDPPIQIFSSALTANRTVTLSTTQAVRGAQFKVVRSGLGAFTLDVGGLKTIPSATAAFVEVTYNGSAWVLTGYGTL